MIIKETVPGSLSGGRKGSVVVRENMKRSTFMKWVDPIDRRAPLQGRQRSDYKVQVGSWANLSIREKTEWERIAALQVGFPKNLPYLVSTRPDVYFFQVKQTIEIWKYHYLTRYPTGGYLDIIPEAGLRIDPGSGDSQIQISFGQGYEFVYARTSIYLEQFRKEVKPYEYLKFIGYIPSRSGGWLNLKGHLYRLFGRQFEHGDRVSLLVWGVGYEEFERTNFLFKQFIID